MVIKSLNTREEWLTVAARIVVDEIFAPATHLPTPRYRVSLTAPRTRGKNKVLGQCWSDSASDDATTEIFITASLGETDSVEILATLVHELVHAYVGVEQQHNHVFASLCRRVGLVGGRTARAASSFTATVPTPALCDQLRDLVEGPMGIGHIPHAKLNAQKNGIKTQTNRNLLMYCSNTTCPFKFRASQAMIDSLRYRTCLICGGATLKQQVK